MAVDEAAFYNAALAAGVGNDFYTWSEGVVDVDVKLLLTAANHRQQAIRVTFVDGLVVEGVPRVVGRCWGIDTSPLSLVNIFLDQVATVEVIDRKRASGKATTPPALFEQRQRLSDLAERR